MNDNNPLIALSNALADAVTTAAASTVLVNARTRIPASGVAITTDTVLTANHVVEREEDINVLLADGTQVPASLLGRDQGSDLALLRLSHALAKPAVKANDARVGQVALALGRPNSGGIQATHGIISAVGGPLRTGRANLLERYLRTDAMALPGFSGGPLVNAAGQVLGINTSGFSPGTLLTIPAELAWAAADTLRAQGRIPRGYLGVRTQVVTLPENLQQKLGRKQDRALMLVGVEGGSAAEKTGLIVGDILAGVGSKPLLDHDDLALHLMRDSVGRSLNLEVIRGGELRNVEIQVREA
ncbi:MAG TPA: trypsin-like peptidase domain-containing protein [Anaerolineaceae bacterium]